MIMSLAALTKVWKSEGVNEDNRLSTSWAELWVYPIPAGLYLVKNLLQMGKKAAQEYYNAGFDDFDNWLPNTHHPCNDFDNLLPTIG